MKILYGVQQPDEGTIAVNGQTLTLRSPPTRSTRASAWCSSTSCWPTTSPSSRTSCSARRSCTASATRRARRSSRSPTPTACGVDPDVLVAELGVGKRQRVEILKVLFRGAKILILDEPTAVLVPQEVAELFDNLRELKAEGLTVIFISHKLDEVLSVADEITVIRRGTTVRPTSTRRPSTPGSWPS